MSSFREYFLNSCIIHYNHISKKSLQNQCVVSVWKLLFYLLHPSYVLLKHPLKEKIPKSLDKNPLNISVKTPPHPSHQLPSVCCQGTTQKSQGFHLNLPWGGTQPTTISTTQRGRSERKGWSRMASKHLTWGGSFFPEKKKNTAETPKTLGGIWKIRVYL